ncbi:HAD-IA family hydrolase [Kitasatospora griseola]|uniref:HAD-IA family hydrolase n=1 Tax=Kitasatospora griseola TaxID=2064 RepID=UPI0038056D0B
MPTRRIVLFDLYGVLALNQRPEAVRHTWSLCSRAEVAVLSNVPADHADALLAAQPWLHAFDHLALSGKTGIAKPDPAAFHHCTAALRAAPADFLFVDDREENVRAARALGMNGHHFTGPEPLEAAIDNWLPVNAA